MNAEIVGQVLIALSTGYVGKALIDYGRDRRKTLKERGLVPVQIESQRVDNVAQQLEILERLNVRLSKRVEQLQDELDQRERLLAELRDQSATLHRELGILQARCQNLQARLDGLTT